METPAYAVKVGILNLFTKVVAFHFVPRGEDLS